MGKKQNNKPLVYQAKNGAIELRGDATIGTIWATLDQIAAVFSRDKSVISRHFTNIFKEKELIKSSVVAKNATTASDGKIYRVEYYNLDAIISVGYRVNSKTATQFRKWATRILREHLIQGYTINRKVIAKNYAAFMDAVTGIQALLPEHAMLDPRSVIELIKEFSGTWLSLDAYDKEKLTPIGSTKKTIKLSGQELISAIRDLRAELLKSKEATDVFAQERAAGSIEGIFGNVMQSFAGKPLYRTMEEKAAHLLYFIVKSHPFVDGNKRSGAFAFIWFMRKARLKGAKNINPSALTALTLLIAESDPKKKNQMTALVTRLLV